MAKIKTPIIKAFREKGGTFCTFNSAIEDIGLNINEKGNNVKLSHYAILDIPNCDYSNSNPNKNVFNLLTPCGAFAQTINDEKYTGDVTKNIAQSFMSYALNMESVIRNQNEMNSSYDFTTPVSISERVFWKWLKETGAIRWQFASKYNEDGSENIEEKNYNYFVEEKDNSKEGGYSRVVKAFGAIDGVSQRSSDYGMYNEVYVNIPTSFGYMNNIFFKSVEDNNYKYNQKYKANTTSYLTLEGCEKDNHILNSGLKNLGYFDYYSNIDTSFNYYLNGEKNKKWFNDVIKTSDFSAYYITDKKVDSSTSSLNDYIEIKDSSNDTLLYSITRSKVDCVSIEMNCDNISKILNINSTTYDELCTKENKENNNIENNYNFNTILIYYSIYDDNNNLLATNLYGVYFLDSPLSKSDDDYIKNRNFTNFEIPRLFKRQSSSKGFGTSYSFRLNIRTSSIYDDRDSDIYDNSSSENSIVNDFNNVVFSLNNTINLLSKYTKYTETLKNKYDEVYNLFLSVNDKLALLEKEYNSIKKYDEDIKEIKESQELTKSSLEEIKENVIYFTNNKA